MDHSCENFASEVLCFENVHFNLQHGHEGFRAENNLECPFSSRSCCLAGTKNNILAEGDNVDQANHHNQ